MRETAVKRISFLLECFMLYEVYSNVCISCNHLPLVHPANLVLQYGPKSFGRRKTGSQLTKRINHEGEGMKKEVVANKHSLNSKTKLYIDKKKDFDKKGRFWQKIDKLLSFDGRTAENANSEGASRKVA